VRNKGVMTLALGTAVLVAFAAPAMAQARPAAPPATTSSSTTSSDPGGEFGIGYSFLHLGGASAAAGFDAYYTQDFRTMSIGSLGFVGDFSVNHSGTFGTGELVTGGVRVNFKTSSKAKFYGQVTGGLSHFPSESQFVLDFGGGVGMPLQGKNFDVFAQVDFPVVFFAGASETGFRLNVGVAIPVGR
jgi:hypothetical protein